MRRLTVSFLVLACLAAGCGGSDTGGAADLVVVTGEAAIPNVDLYRQPVADPAKRAGAAADYIDCTFEIWQGGWSMDFGPPGSASDPEGALSRFLDEGLFSLPAGGFAPAGSDEHRMLYTYSVDGLPKVAVIVADATEVELDADDGWVAETFASCDPAEYDSSTDGQLFLNVWLDANGNRVPTSIITSARGAEHCDWDSVTFLTFEDRQYIRDPQGVLRNSGLVVPFDDNADIPDDAINTGYHRDGRQLWVSTDASIAYLVVGDRVEVWPTATTPIGCA